MQDPKRRGSQSEKWVDPKNFGTKLFCGLKFRRLHLRNSVSKTQKVKENSVNHSGQNMDVFMKLRWILVQEDNRIF